MKHPEALKAAKNEINEKLQETPLTEINKQDLDDMKVLSKLLTSMLQKYFFRRLYLPLAGSSRFGRLIKISLILYSSDL